MHFISELHIVSIYSIIFTYISKFYIYAYHILTAYRTKICKNHSVHEQIPHLMRIKSEEHIETKDAKIIAYISKFHVYAYHIRTTYRDEICRNHYVHKQIPHCFSNIIVFSMKLRMNRNQFDLTISKSYEN